MFIPDVISQERADFARTLKQFLVSRKQADGADRAYDPILWAGLSEQFGLAGLMIPEELGGSGFGIGEMVVVQKELGRVLAPVPYFSSGVLAATLLLELDDAQANRDVVPRLAEGELVATVALWSASGTWEQIGSGVRAVPSPDGSWELHGESWYVTDAAAAGAILVLARTDEGQQVFLVEGEQPGLGREALETLDLTRPQALVTLDRVKALPLGRPGDTARAVSRTLDLAILALAAEQVGGAEAAMTMALEYAKVRVQFGRAIGSFQAIKHKLSDMALDLERMKAAVDNLAELLEKDDAAASGAASLVKSFCSEAFFRIAAENIQVHGGIGFTWEHPAHLYFRRAKTAELYFGSSAEHRARMLTALEV